MTNLWRWLRWYPWRDQEDWIRSQEGAWWPWPKPRFDALGLPQK